MKINYLIDGNHFIQRVFSVLGSEQRLSQNDIIGIWFNNLKSHISDFDGLIKRVVFAVDYGTWRNDVFDEVEYKGSRKKKRKERTEEEIEMYNLMFENYDTFQTELEKEGIIVNKVSGAEGDDIIYFWKDKLMSMGENCVIYSGDSDLRQLVDWNGKNWTISAEQNPHHKQVLTYPGFKEEYLNHDDVFNMKGVKLKSKVEKLIQKLGKYREINPRYTILEKVISGDKGDSIPAMYYKKVKNGYQRLGTRSAEKIINKYEKYYGEIDNVLDEQFIEDFIKIIIQVGKIEDKSFAELKSKFRRNLKLVHLHHSHYPSGILKALNSAIEGNISKKFKGSKNLKLKSSETQNRNYDTKELKDYDPDDDFDIENLI